ISFGKAIAQPSNRLYQIRFSRSTSSNQNRHRLKSDRNVLKAFEVRDSDSLEHVISDCGNKKNNYMMPFWRQGTPKAIEFVGSIGFSPLARTRSTTPH